MSHKWSEEQKKKFKETQARKAGLATKKIYGPNGQGSLLEEHRQFITRVDARIKEIQQVLDDLNLEKIQLEALLGAPEVKKEEDAELREH